MKWNKLLSIATTVLFLGVLTVNALANILPINGYNTGELSDMLPNLFVPAGITFSIWGLIYFMMAVLTIQNIRDSFMTIGFSRKSQMTLAVNYILNMLWILAWHYRLIALSLIIMLGLFATLLFLDGDTRKMEFSGTWRKWVYRWPVLVYFGWISVATIANVTALLVYYGWDGSPFSPRFWTILVILTGALVALLKVWLYQDFPFALVFIWAYAGIILKRSSLFPRENAIIFVTGVSIGLILLTAVFSIFRNRKIPHYGS